MRKGLCVPMMALVLLLAGCGAGEKEDPRAAYQEMAGCTMEATVRCDQEGLDWEGTLRCDYVPGGQSTVEVVAPELLAGVKAIISDRDWSLSYEGETLNIAPLSEEELSPAVCLPRLMDALRSGWLLEENRETWNGEACIRLLVDQSGASGGKVVSAFWLREEDAVPLHAELAVGEETVFTVEFTEFDFDDTIEGMEAAASER
ncbi:MAG: hypothetical protein PUC45_07295 [Oscillospiraceae bacterium]|nr:hypothetical protein [Oscillospiraceae bacterium]